MPSVLHTEWMGRRVSLRRVVERAPDGRLLLGDVVGRLAGLDAQTAVVETRAGLVEVPLALVTAARVVPPSTADELALQDVAAQGWPAADTEQLDGWVLRADPGGTSRANSVLPARQLQIPFDEALARVRAFYAARDLAALFQAPTESRRLLGAELAERGWQAEGLTNVLVTEVRTPPPGQIEVDLAEQPDDDWLAMSTSATDEPRARRALLTRHPGAVFASARFGGTLAAIGRASVDRGWLGITTVEVAAAHRRQGLGGEITAALHRWGRAGGADRAYVQVLATNAGAHALYERAGYRQHHDYHYLREPVSP